MLPYRSLHEVQVKVCVGAVGEGHHELGYLSGHSMARFGHGLGEIVSERLDFIGIEGALIDCVAHSVVVS